MTKKSNPGVPRLGRKSIATIGQAERTEIVQRLAKRSDLLREKYPEVRGKVVEFVSNSIEDGTLYFATRFTDNTELTLRYCSWMVASGADLFDVKTGHLNLIRRYMRPILS